jgi:hypothetical protein
VIRLELACGDAQQGRFSGAVPAYEADPVARPDGEVRLLDQGPPAECQAGILEIQERWSHPAPLAFRSPEGKLSGNP